MELVRWGFGRTNAVRMSGVALVGLVMGLPEEERPREETSPPMDHWS